MKKELEVISKQLSDIASKILSTEDIDQLENDLKIYENFLNQIVQICNNRLEEDEKELVKNINSRNKEIMSHLEKIKSNIKNNIKNQNVDISIYKIFTSSVEKSSLIDKKA